MANELESVRIVLCRPSHPGNIGSAARAMKNMGLADLRLVAPQRFPAPEAEWLASGAVDVLEAARVHATLAEAIGECVAAYALSARPREWSPRALALREAAGAALERAAQGPVAFVFGNETAGLSNDEMFACQHAGAHPGRSRLHLAQSGAGGAGRVLRAAHGAGRGGAGDAQREAGHERGPGGALRSSRAGRDANRLHGARLQAARAVAAAFFRVPALEREEVNILRGLLKALQKRQ